MFDTGVKSVYVQWPQLRLVFNVGAVWLIAQVLSEEEKIVSELGQDKNVEAITQNI